MQTNFINIFLKIEARFFKTAISLIKKKFFGRLYKIWEEDKVRYCTQYQQRKSMNMKRMYTGTMTVLKL
jgi:hypothetical protein